MKLIVGTGEVTAVGGGEENDSLAREAICLDEGVDDGGSRVPPDEEATIDDIITVGVLQVLYDSRAGTLVPHFYTAAGLLVAPVHLNTSHVNFH